MVAGEVLRRRVEDEVAAALERAQVDRRRRGRVADDEARVRGGGLEVGHRQERVRRRLDPDEVGAGRRRAGLVEEDVPEPPALELGEEDAGAVVGVLRERDRRAGREQREHERGRRAHPRREEQRLAAVELAELPLRLDPDRVRVPRVVERPRLAVDVRPGRRAVERRLHAPVSVTQSPTAPFAVDPCVTGTSPALGCAHGRDPRHDRRQARLAAGALRAGRARRQREGGRAAAGAGEAARARAGREAARPGLVRRARPLRPPPQPRLRLDGEPARTATRSSPATARSSAARSSSSRRTSPSSAARSPRSSPRRSAR